MNKIVLQKFIVESGYCSRREATELIRQDKVKINGKTAELGQRVFLNDDVMIGREKINSQKEKIYIILNKPEGYVCTNRRFKNEKNVFDLLVDREGKYPQLRERMFVVGRLDKNSQGLVIITNNGELAQKITHPKYEHEKVYEIKLRISPSRQVQANCECRMDKNEIIKKFNKGIDIGEGDGVVKAERIKSLGDNKFQVTLTQGKKRQIRRMFKVMGLEVVNLKRVGIGSGQAKINLGDLKKGEWRCMGEEEVSKLKR